MLETLTTSKKNFYSIFPIKPQKKGGSIVLIKLSYTVLLLSTLFFVRCGVSDTVDVLDTLDAKDTNTLLNKITLNNEHVKEENLNNELTLYLGEKFVFNIPKATELFDADKNNNNQIKAKITNQEDLTLATFIIEENTLTINPRKIGNGTFTLTYTTSYNNLGVIINNKIKKIISDSFTKKINYKIIHNLNEIRIPKNFPKTITVTQHTEKKITLPAITDKLRKLVVPKVSTMENDIKLTALDNILTIFSSTIGTRTITLKYKTLEKIHTDNRQYTSTAKSVDIIIITKAQANKITIPANFPTTLTVSQNISKTLSLPSVIDSFNTAIVPTANDPIATLDGKLLTIISPTIGIKTITLTYTSQTTNEKTATTKTRNILLTTVAPIQNTITIPANFTTTFTVIQNVAKILTLPAVTDSFNTVIVPTVSDPIATLNGNSLIIISPTIGTKTITLTYTSQNKNEKVATTKIANIRLTTIAKIPLKNKLKVVSTPSEKTQPTPPFKGLYPLSAVVGTDQKNSAEILTVQDVATEEIMPTFSVNSTRFSLSISIKVINGKNRYIANFQYLGGTGNEEVLVDFTWTSKAKTINGKKYELADSYTNSIRVKLTDQLAKEVIYQKRIASLERGVLKYLSKRDGEVIQINLKNKERKVIHSIPQEYRLLLIPNYPPIYLFGYGAQVVPTITLNNEGDSAIKINYRKLSYTPGLKPISVTLSDGSTNGKGVIKLVYKSNESKIRWFEDFNKDGALDHIVYPLLTITLYIEVNGAKKDEATFPSTN